MIVTQRLRIAPLSDEEMERLIAGEPDPELRVAYTEMREAALREPEERLWYTAWQLRLLETGEAVGDLCFKGVTPEGIVEIGYGMYPAFQGRGLMTEAVKAMVSWALEQPRVRQIQAETDSGNRASQKVLQKAGFRPTGEMGEEGPRFRWEP